ncbi:MAG: hypothetical protein WCO89_11435 [Syntrophus sp. (in: bacteria)]
MTNNDPAAGDYARLQAQLARIDGMRKLSFYSPGFQTWHRQTGELIENIFGKNSPCYEAYQAIIFTPLFLSCRCSDTIFTEAYEQGLEEIRSLFASYFKKA